MKLFVRIYDIAVDNARRAAATAVLAWLLVVGIIDEFAPREQPKDRIKEQLKTTAVELGAQRAALSEFTGDERRILNSVRNNTPVGIQPTATVRRVTTAEEIEWRDKSFRSECYSYSVHSAASDGEFKALVQSAGAVSLYACPVELFDSSGNSVFKGSLSVSYDLLDTQPEVIFSTLRFKAAQMETLLQKSGSF